MKLSDLLNFRNSSKRSSRRRAIRRRPGSVAVPGSVENLEKRALLSSTNGDAVEIDGTAKTDEIRVTRIDDATALVQINSFDSRNFTNQTGSNEFEVDPRDGVLIRGLGENDRILIDASIATSIHVDGGSDDQDEVFVFGDGTDAAMYLPTDVDSGAITFGNGFELEFDGTETAVIRSTDTLQVVTPTGEDRIYASRTSDGRVRLSGTSQGEDLAAVEFTSVQAVVLDLGANDTEDSQNDWFETKGRGLSDSGADVFTVNAGKGNDRFLIRPATDTEIQVNGGSPVGDSGDLLTVELAGVRNYRLPTNLRDGRVTSSSHADVAFSSMETVESTAVDMLAPSGIVSDVSPTIRWTANPNAQSYEVWVGNLENRQRVLHATDVTGTSWTDEDNELGLGRHRAWVRPIVEGQPSAWSSPIDFRISVAPTAFLFSKNELDMTPTLVWDSASGASKFEVWVSNVTANTSKTYTVSGDLDRFTIPDTDALPLGHYRYAVRAFDAKDIPTEWSRIRSFRIVTRPEIISPNLPSIEPMTTFKWTEVAGASRYRLFVNRINPDGTETKVLDKDDITETSYQVTEQLKPGRYRFWVQAWNGTVARSVWSKPATFETGTEIIPQITGPAEVVNSLSPTVTWTPLHGVARYELWISESNDESPFIKNDRVYTNSFTTDQILPSGKYFAWVRAISIRGKITEWSDPFLFESNGGTPRVTAPVGSVNDFLPRITWTAIDDAAKYELFVRQTRGGSTQYSVADITDNGFTPITPFDNGTYRVWVRAFSSNGESSAWSEAREFSVST